MDSNGVDKKSTDKRNDAFDFQISSKAAPANKPSDALSSSAQSSSAQSNVKNASPKGSAGERPGHSDSVKSDNKKSDNKKPGTDHVDNASEPPPRRPAEQRENAFNTLAWLAEGATGIIEELRHSDLGLGEDFWKHAYAARRESLLAAQSLINQLVERAEEQERKKEESQQRRARRGDINIDF